MCTRYIIYYSYIIYELGFSSSLDCKLLCPLLWPSTPPPLLQAYLTKNPIIPFPPGPLLHRTCQLSLRLMLVHEVVALPQLQPPHSPCRHRSQHLPRTQSVKITLMVYCIPTNHQHRNRYSRRCTPSSGIVQTRSIDSHRNMTLI